MIFILRDFVDRQLRERRNHLHHDDVRSAAIALTSLSLSPASTRCSSSDDVLKKTGKFFLHYSKVSNLVQPRPKGFFSLFFLNKSEI